MGKARGPLCVALLCVFAVTLIPSVSHAQQMGVSFVGGLGLFVVSDKDVYADIAADLYPEVGLMIDVSIIRAGVKAGLIYRSYEEWSTYYDPYNYNPYYDEYTRSFVPLQLDLQIAPLIGSDITPYVGIMPGIFISVGDDDENPLAISIKGGLEFKMEPLILYGDLRYTYAKADLPKLTLNPWGGGVGRVEDVDLGGFMIVVGGGLRFGSW